MRLSFEERLERLTVPEPNTGCLLWLGDTVLGGYGRIRVHPKKMLVHRAVWAQRHGPIPEGYVIMHRCDQPACCRIDHLQMGTALENIADRQSKGRQARGARHAHLVGENNGISVLTESLVREIRELYATGEYSQLEIARRFSIGQMTVSCVVRRLRWRHVA